MLAALAVIFILPVGWVVQGVRGQTKTPLFRSILVLQSHPQVLP